MALHYSSSEDRSEDTRYEQTNDDCNYSIPIENCPHRCWMEVLELEQKI